MRYTFHFICLLLLLSSWMAAQNDPISPPPNIVLILADDAGYADFGFHGSREFRTPELDQLAAEGVRFEQAYVSASICAPSRAGLMTGRHQQRFGYEDNIPHHPQPYLRLDELGLPPSEQTLGSYLQQAGYRTSYIGKWHLGEDAKHHPCRRGFDHYLGFKRGFHAYYPHEEHDARDPVLRNFRPAGPLPYLTTAFGEEAVDFIQASRHQPFFLYLSFNAVHTPMHVEESDLSGFSNITDEKRRKLAAMTLAMDHAIGRVLDTLRDEGLEENTLVIFFNDNGGSARNASNNHPLRGHKNSMWEGGLRVPLLLRWPAAGLSGGRTYQPPVIAQDITATCVAAARVEKAARKKLDGVDLLPFLTGNRKEMPHQTLYWREVELAAIRDGDWKLIRFPDRPAELFDLSQDIGEATNLATEHPEKVLDLYQKLHAWEQNMASPAWYYNRL